MSFTETNTYYNYSFLVFFILMFIDLRFKTSLSILAILLNMVVSIAMSQKFHPRFSPKFSHLKVLKFKTFSKLTHALKNTTNSSKMLISCP